MINLTANLEETLILPCNASGIPEPVVSWVKMPNIDIIGNEDSEYSFKFIENFLSRGQDFSTRD